MKELKSIKWRWWIVFAVLVIISDRWDHISRQKLLRESLSTTIIPAPNPQMGAPLFYSMQKHEWVYSTQSGAKASYNIKSPNEDIESYLKKKIPIYRNKTYWGEEWTDDDDKPDIIWDDEGDDDELDDEYKMK